jgi:phospholipid/cholesterol/gamma-HCH transport system substrate-binding protein
MSATSSSPPPTPPPPPGSSNGHGQNGHGHDHGRHEGGLSVREQIERYRTAFIAVVTMIVIAAGTGGYILAHQNLKLPSWVPVLGKEWFVLKGEFQTAQAVTPGQGQAVTIAGAKIGEVQSVDLRNGVAVVTMKITPKYALIYHDATMLLRPKTQLKDMTVEVDPGSPSSGRLRSGETIPLAQTAPDANFEEFLAGFDAETRDYLQLLLAGAGEGLKGNGRALSAALKRFDPLARDAQEIAQELESRHVEIAQAIHNFKLLMEAFGEHDTQLADLIQSSNTVFKVFSEQSQAVQSTLRQLPGALGKTEQGLGKLATAFNLVGPTLHELHPFAQAVAPAEEASRASFKVTTPIIKNDIRPFAHEVQPTIKMLQPSLADVADAFPQLASSFSVINEFFNEIAYNPGKKQGGFLFFLDWDSHNFNSVLSSADAHGPLGRTLIYFNCNVLPLLLPVSKVNPTVNILVGLLNPPSTAECQRFGLSASAAGTKATAASAKSGAPAGGASGVFSSLGAAHVFGGKG